VENLPVGIQQRVEIIKALVRDASVLILDEPTAVLTPAEADDLFRIIRQLKDGGTSIVFGVVVNMIVSTLIGMTYGLLFRHEAPDAASAIAWGLVYGLLWWFIGPMTLQPILLREPLRGSRVLKCQNTTTLRRPLPISRRGSTRR
jgi:hypothetical protein